MHPQIGGKDEVIGKQLLLPFGRDVKHLRDSAPSESRIEEGIDRFAVYQMIGQCRYILRRERILAPENDSPPLLAQIAGRLGYELSQKLSDTAGLPRRAASSLERPT